MGWWWSEDKKPQSLQNPPERDTSSPSNPPFASYDEPRAPSPPTQSQPASSLQRPTALPDDAPPPAPSTSESSPTSGSPLQTDAPLDRDSQAFSDLKDLFTQIDPERSARASTAAREYAAQEPQLDPDSLYASEMSCSACFDLAYYCSSLGGQLNNVYRFGGLRSCTEQWAQWRFCMRTKAMTEDTRRMKIREWNQRKAAQFKLGKSSEDVWEARKVPVDGAFAKSIDDYEY